MGLDMYLDKEISVKNWNFEVEENGKFTLTVKRGGKKYPHVNTKKVKLVTQEVAYWRKANHIHKWFVDNVQGGEDDCDTYYVDVEQLKELVEACKKAISNVVDGVAVGAEDILPTTSGCFFGATGYGEDYIRDCKYTIETLEPELASEIGYFQYHSSW